MSAEPRAYEVDLPGLTGLVAAAKPTDKHKDLLVALRGFRGGWDLHAARITAVRGDAWLARCKVVDADGRLLHPDYEAFLRLECDGDGGDVALTWRRLMPLGYNLTECGLTTLYVTVDRGGAAADDFLQLEVVVEDESVDRRMFYPDRSWSPRNLEELCRLSEEGPGVKVRRGRATVRRHTACAGRSRSPSS